jgi:hypothetical protein
MLLSFIVAAEMLPPGIPLTPEMHKLIDGIKNQISPEKRIEKRILINEYDVTGKSMNDYIKNLGKSKN